MTHWSEQDLAHLPTEQREAQERGMGVVYETSTENELDTALAITEHEALAKVESSEEETLSEQEEQEQIVMQVRRGLSMRQAAREVDSKAIKHLLGMPHADKHGGAAVAGGHAITCGRAAAEHEGTVRTADGGECGSLRIPQAAGSSPTTKNQEAVEPLGELYFNSRPQTSV
jgi:hypothetical protein